MRNPSVGPGDRAAGAAWDELQAFVSQPGRPSQFRGILGSSAIGNLEDGGSAAQRARATGFHGGASTLAEEPGVCELGGFSAWSG